MRGSCLPSELVREWTFGLECNLYIRWIGSLYDLAVSKNMECKRSDLVSMYQRSSSSKFSQSSRRRHTLSQPLHPSIHKDRRTLRHLPPNRLPRILIQARLILKRPLQLTSIRLGEVLCVYKGTQRLTWVPTENVYLVSGAFVKPSLDPPPNSRKIRRRVNNNHHP